jgi:tRNA modification GTPase
VAARSRTATGEDSAELHLHGGRAVVAAVLAALAALPGLRQALPGEFTRRAFANGRIDLAEAEGLADLLTAETELQRRAALAMADGALSRLVAGWRDKVLALSARLEAALDFSDEDDVGADLPAGFAADAGALADDLGAWLARPRAEPLREGYRVVLAGPPNAGKSTLFNALVDDEAAITAAEPGPRAMFWSARWRSMACPSRSSIRPACAKTAPARSNGSASPARWRKAEPRIWCCGWGRRGRACRSSAVGNRNTDRPSGSGDQARRAVRAFGADGGGHVGVSRRVGGSCPRGVARSGRSGAECAPGGVAGEVMTALGAAAAMPDPLLAAEELRLARQALDRLVGRVGTEDMLDALFGRFCIGNEAQCSTWNIDAL